MEKRKPRPRTRARQIRENAGLRIDDVVRRTRIGSNHLYKFEQGTQGFSVERLYELAKLYGCTMEDLIAEDAEPAQKDLEPVA